jgi:hypothetical protein
MTTAIFLVICLMIGLIVVKYRVAIVLGFVYVVWTLNSFLRRVL